MPAPTITIPVTTNPITGREQTSVERINQAVNAGLAELYSEAAETFATSAGLAAEAGARAVAVGAVSEGVYRASLWQFLGDSATPISNPPMTATESGRVLSHATGAATLEDVYLANLWQFLGDGETDDPPLIASRNGRVLLSVSTLAGGSADAALNPVIWVRTDDGQSNGEGAAYASRSVVYGTTDPLMLTMRRGTNADPWLGMATAGGTSLQLDGDTITSIGPMVPQELNLSGTLAGEAAARTLIARTGQRVLTLSNAEGGQSIFNLLPGAPAGFYADANIETWMTRAQAVKPAGSALRYATMLMVQGETNRSEANLGALHHQYQQAQQEKAARIWGQTEAIRMISWQFSSTPATGGGATGFVGAQSILDFAIAHDADAAIRHKVFFCGGPTYQFPWAVDYLHQSSIGHAMRGEMADAIDRRIDSEGFFLPLYPVSAAVTGANQITVIMSETCEDATDTHVAAVANLGVGLTGAAVSGVSVSGNAVTITTSDPASGATLVGFGAQRHSEPRTQETIPRTNIRAARPLGAYSPTLAPQSAGGLIRNWCSHRVIPITA
ncbi:MAG: hypothetical protein ACK4NW_01940 [Roseinatronobacter sp.]